MDIFRKAKSIRMVSYRDKYLTAEEDEESVIQDEEQRRQSEWTVELVEDRNAIRLRSCFGTYLTASTIPLLPGVTAKKTVQTSCPSRSASDRAIEWEPQRDGMQVKLRSCSGNFLRPNGGLPPWRNIVTHDIPHLPNSGNKLLWDVQIVEKRPPPVAAPSPSKFGRCRSGSFSETMDAIMPSQESI